MVEVSFIFFVFRFFSCTSSSRGEFFWSWPFISIKNKRMLLLTIIINAIKLRRIFETQLLPSACSTATCNSKWVGMELAPQSNPLLEVCIVSSSFNSRRKKRTVFSRNHYHKIKIRNNKSRYVKLHMLLYIASCNMYQTIFFFCGSQFVSNLDSKNNMYEEYIHVSARYGSLMCYPSSNFSRGTCRQMELKFSFEPKYPQNVKKNDIFVALLHKPFNITSSNTRYMLHSLVQ